MNQLRIRVGNIKEVKFDLTELPPDSYEIITKSYWCNGEEFLSFEDFKKSEYYSKGYRCKVEKDRIWFEKCKWGFVFNDEVNIRNAKKCGFGVLVYKPTGEKIIFNNCSEITIFSIIAYQAITYHCVNKHYLPFLTDPLTHEYFKDYIKLCLDHNLYTEVMKCLICDLN